MKKNKLQTIAGQEFVCTAAAAQILELHLKSVRRRYLLRPAARRSLEEALRDVLVSVMPKAAGTVTKPQANKAVALVGDAFEGHDFGLQQLGRLKQGVGHAFSVIKTVTKRPRVQRVFWHALAGLFVVLAAISLVIKLQDPPPPPQTDGNYTIETVIGRVRSPAWAEIPTFPNYPSAANWATAGFVAGMTAAVFILVWLYRQQFTVFALIAVILSGSVWLYLGFKLRHDRQQHHRLLQASNSQTIETERTTDDLDTLLACGTEINYVMGLQAGRLFYLFQDQGFRLKTELERNGTYGYPDRAAICSAFDELRRSYRDDQIVLQMFIRDQAGTIRPFDYQEKYPSEAGDFLSRYPLRYGFFVQTSTAQP